MRGEFDTRNWVVHMCAPAVLLFVAASAAILVLFVGGSPPFCRNIVRLAYKKGWKPDPDHVCRNEGDPAAFRPVMPGYG